MIRRMFTGVIFLGVVVHVLVLAPISDARRAMKDHHKNEDA